MRYSQSTSLQRRQRPRLACANRSIIERRRTLNIHSTILTCRNAAALKAIRCLGRAVAGGPTVETPFLRSDKGAPPILRVELHVREMRGEAVHGQVGARRVVRCASYRDDTHFVLVCDLCFFLRGRSERLSAHAAASPETPLAPRARVGGIHPQTRPLHLLELGLQTRPRVLCHHAFSRY